ncbi:MAG: arylesterase [Gammaproteobacteria bacterium]|nr:arylesterase [Gammaproteobacteria bacterium]
MLRMGRLAIRLLLPLALLGSAADAGAEVPRQPPGVLLVLGDSLSAAYGIPEEQSWVNLLQERLGSAYRVENASVSGETTQGGLARIVKTLELYEPDIVIIELGGNDGLRGLPIASIRDNLRTMTEAVKAAGAQPVLAGMLMPPNLGPRYTEAFEQLYVDVAEATGAALVPFLLDGVAATDEDLMLPDGIHPSAAAQERLVENVWEVLAPLVEGDIHASD